MRLTPPRELADRLGEPPERGVERELWERQAVRLELHRAPHGELPDQQDPLPEAAPADWRTAPAELARTAPDRPDQPAAERLLLDIGADTFDLGP